MATKRKECDTGGRSSSVETTKKKKYTVSFKPEYTIEFPCIVRGKDSSLARCKICDSEFRIDHAGRDAKHNRFQFLRMQVMTKQINFFHS